MVTRQIQRWAGSFDIPRKSVSFASAKDDYLRQREIQVPGAGRKMIRNDTVEARMAALKPVVETRLKSAEKITQVVEDEVMTPAGRVLFASYNSAGARMAEDSAESRMGRLFFGQEFHYPGIFLTNFFKNTSYHDRVRRMGYQANNISGFDFSALQSRIVIARLTMCDVDITSILAPATGGLL